MVCMHIDGPWELMHSCKKMETSDKIMRSNIYRAGEREACKEEGVGGG